MPKQWWEYLIDAGITLFATGVGVYGAFYVDNLRDKIAKRDLKNRLIRGLSHEIVMLEKFIYDKQRLEFGTDYFIETHVLEDTVRDQIDYLDNSELIESLSNLRFLVSRVKRHLELWSEVNVVLIKNPFDEWDKIKSKLITEWNSFRVETPSQFKIVKGLLEKEAIS